MSGAARIEGWLAPAGEADPIVRPLVGFLAHPLDEVTGHPEELREKATAWRAAAGELRQHAETEAAARGVLLPQWEGAAADAFDREMTAIQVSLVEAADHFDATAELLERAAEGVRQAQDLVEQIVRELIAWLIVTIIVALASSWITLGASVAAGAAAGAVEAGLAGTRAATVALRLATLLREVAAFLKKMSDFARAYKLSSIRKVGAGRWASARYASRPGYELLATNWAIKKAIVQPALGPVVDRTTGAGEQWKLPGAL